MPDDPAKSPRGGRPQNMALLKVLWIAPGVLGKSQVWFTKDILSRAADRLSH